MDRSRSRQNSFLLILFLFLSGFLRGAELSPMEAIKTSNQQILAIYRTNDVIDRTVEEKITKIMDSVTDFDIISTRTLERICLRLKKEECDILDRTFRKLLRISAVKKLGRYRADRFDYIEEKIEGTTAVVKTIAYYEEEKIHLDYMMERIGGSWMIVNYIADDVDAIRNYRKQFNRILRKEPFSLLIERLEAKINEYQDEKKSKG